MRRWTRELIIEKILEWEARYGEPPSSADWNPSLARWRAQEWRAERYREGVWPSTNAAKRPFDGSFDAAVRAAGLEPRRPGPRRRAAGEARPDVAQREPERVTVAGDQLAVALERARVAEGRAAALERGLLVADARGEALDRVETLIADADARVRAADDQAAAAVRDAAEWREAATRAERRARELSALVGDGQRRLTPGELGALRGDGPSGPAVLAAALRRLAKARAAGDRGGLRSALGEVASAAVRWHDRL
ncbi:MAG TPA: hypothetical protein VNO82_13020 [Solirubrobacteraceae bacterium]|nr:hypothetical protein [Solirubrobacteraceae bacterium]